MIILDPLLESLVWCIRNGINSVTIFSSDDNFNLNANENDVSKSPILEKTEAEMDNIFGSSVDEVSKLIIAQIQVIS